MKTKTSCNATPRGLVSRKHDSAELDDPAADERIAHALAPYRDALHAHAESPQGTLTYVSAALTAKYVYSPDSYTRTYLVCIAGVQGCSIIAVSIDRAQTNDDDTPAHADALHAHAESAAYATEYIGPGVCAVSDWPYHLDGKYGVCEGEVRLRPGVASDVGAVRRFGCSGAMVAA